jgi:hypothetical protein
MPRRRLDKVVVAVLDKAEILIQHTIDISPPFLDVPLDPSSKHEI